LSDNEEINIYGTKPNTADTDGDGIVDGDEVAFWGSNWNLDYDGDGIFNPFIYLMIDRSSRLNQRGFPVNPCSSAYIRVPKIPGLPAFQAINLNYSRHALHERK
jgi:hypothetical protein